MPGFRTALKNTRWFVSIGAKMMRTHPVATCVAITAMLAGQIAQILAMLLPLKVVLLIGSDGVPAYFPEFLKAYTKSTLILGLSISAAGFYFFHFLMKLLADRSVTRGASQITTRNLKIATIPNQEARLRALYTQAARAASDLWFAAIAFVGVTLLRPAFGAAVAGILLLMAATLTILSGLAQKRSRSVNWNSTESLPSQISTCATLGFFLSFAVIIVDYLSTQSINLLIAIVCLLISRQLFQKLAGGVLAVIRLAASRALVEQLFYHRLPTTGRASQARTIWSLLDQPANSSLLVEHLDDCFGHSDANWEIDWIQTGIADELTMIVTRPGEAERRRMLMKVYGVNREHIAVQEATLAQEVQDFDLIGLKLLHRGELAGFACLCFELDGGQYVARERLPEARRELATRLLTHTVRPKLVSRFRRSRQSLPQRLSQEPIARIRSVVSDEEQKQQLDAFFQALPNMEERLNRLPAQLITRNLYARGFLVRSDAGHTVCTHWGNWSIEPVGFAWPIAELSALPAVARKAGLPPQHDADDLILTALLSELELRCRRRLYTDALALLPALLEHADSAAKQTITDDAQARSS